MRTWVLGVMLAVTPTGPAAKLVAIWLDRGSPYMELRPDGSGRIGPAEANWTAEKDVIHVVNKDSGDAYDLSYTLEPGGKKVKLIVQGTTVELERSSKKPAAKAPPPPKTPSQLAEEADGGTKDAKKKPKGKK